MKPSALSPDQRKRLQTLYAQACAHSLDFSSAREARIAWAASLVQRDLTSMNDLTKAEAGHLIDALQAFLGVATGNGTARKFMPRSQAQRAGTDGRKDSPFAQNPQLVRQEDIDRIDRLRLGLGWTREDLDRFLWSRRSPLRKSKQRDVRTTADANKVIWALQRRANHKPEAA